MNKIFTTEDDKETILMDRISFRHCSCFFITIDLTALLIQNYEPSLISNILLILLLKMSGKDVSKYFFRKFENYVKI